MEFQMGPKDLGLEIVQNGLQEHRFAQCQMERGAAGLGLGVPEDIGLWQHRSAAPLP